MLEEKESGYIEQLESGESGELIVRDEVLPLAVTDEKAIRNVIQQEALTIASNIVASKDEAELQKYIAEFNLNMSKKNVLRTIKYDELLDKVSDEALHRAEKHPDEFTAMELLNYIKTTQEAINNNKKTSSDYVDNTAPITLNQQNNTVNVNIDNTSEQRIDRRSKERIIDAVNKLLNLSLESVETNNEENKE